MSETNSFQFPEQTTGTARSTKTESAKLPDLSGHVFFEKIGVGGMGEVFRCGDDALQRDLAIKVLQAELHGLQDLNGQHSRWSVCNWGRRWPMNSGVCAT
jgi:hypothetical protein